VGLQLAGDVSPFRLDALARFEPDRWYRGPRPKEVWVHFKWDAMRVLNHDCENLQLGTRWLVFAKESLGRLELVDDCNRAIPVSAELGAPTHGDYLSQMEADFAAGRKDARISRRVWRLWWLGRLRMPSSRPLLQKWIESSGGIEKKWAQYALSWSAGNWKDPRKESNGEVDLCGGWGFDPFPANPLNSSWPSDKELKSAKTDWGLGCVMRFLGDTKDVQDTWALPVIASRLEDSRPSVRWDAIGAMYDITNSKACVPSGSPQAGWKCAAWWKQHQQEYHLNIRDSEQH
jgi:hypothetical protein